MKARFTFVFGLTSLLASAPAFAGGVELCFANEIDNVALLTAVSGTELGVVVTSLPSKTNYITANTNVAANGPGNFWKSPLPTITKIQAGCSVFFFMFKTGGENNGAAPWTCAETVVETTPKSNSGNQNLVVSGELGATAAAIVVIPGMPNQYPKSVNDCPNG